MESSQGITGAARDFDEPNANANLHEVKDIDVRMEPCGSCEGCSATEDCGTKCENCIQNYIENAIENKGNPNILPCLKRMCHATVIVYNDRIKDEQEIKPNQNETRMNESMEHGETGFKKSMKLDEFSSDENLVISESGNDLNVEKCGICLGCTTDCGNCWACIQREVVATKDLTPKMICQEKKCLLQEETKKEGENKIKKEDDVKVKHQKRKRCGTCPGCVVAQNCGNCGSCVRRQRYMIEGRKFKDICNERKCHALKIPKTRCEECEGCQSQSCGKCSFCIGVNKNLCPLRRCHKKMDKINSKPFQSDKFYGHGIKIKPKKAKPNADMDDDIACEDDHMFIANDSLIDIDQLTMDQTSKLTEVEKWLNENVQFEENLDTDKKNDKNYDLGTNSSSKLANPKSVKRTKKCGECAGCQAEYCGHCRSCEINDQFSDNLVLGKVPCLTNICEFPVELTGDMDAVSLMSLQDDSSNGTVCPVKIINGVLYDFRCFFCKKLPRAGSTARSELMRHYSNAHFAQEIRKDYKIFVVDGHCLLCDGQIVKGGSITSHIGQKHNEIENYLPPEAIALCPKVIQKGQIGVRRHPRPAAVSSQTSSAEVLDWPQVPKGFNSSTKDRNWKRNTSHDSSKEMETEDVEIVDGWTIEHVTNSDEELPDPTLDYSGVGGRCSICQREFDEVTDAVLHLHKDHDIDGGSSYLMKDCQNFIKSRFIQVSKVQNEILPPAIHDKVDENVTSSPNSDYLDFEAKRYISKKATSRKLSMPYRNVAQKSSSSTLMKELITPRNSQHSSLNDEETSAQCDEIEIEFLPSIICDKADENSMPSRNVARKSTGKKPWSSTLMKEQITPRNSQHSSLNDEETSAQCDEIEMEFLPATVCDKADENSMPSRNVARKSTGQKSWSSTLMNEQVTPRNSQYSSSNDKETSSQRGEIGMALLPATSYYNADRNSMPSHNVAQKSTQESLSSTFMKEHITPRNSQHSSSSDEETSAQSNEIGMALHPATVHYKADRNSKPSRNVARKSTCQESWGSSTLMKEQITHENTQHSSKNNQETSAQSNVIGIELLPTTINNKDGENSILSLNSDDYFMSLDFESKRFVAWKSTGQNSPSSMSHMREQITRGTFQHSSSNDEETSVLERNLEIENDME